MTNPEPPRWSAADEVLAQLKGEALVQETTDHLAGRVWITVWHGDPETADDAHRVASLADKAMSLNQTWPGCVRLRQGGNDYTAIQFGPADSAPDPTALAEDLATFAAAIAPRCQHLDRGTWWHVTQA